MDVLVNGEALDALSLIVHREKAFPEARCWSTKMKEIHPGRQMFRWVAPLQAAIGNRIIARETVKACGRMSPRNVMAAIHISRKRKTLEKQKEGSQRMKWVGKVEIPQEAFLAVLKID